MQTLEIKTLDVLKYKVIIIDNFYTDEEYSSMLKECLFLSERNKLLDPEKTASAKDSEGNQLKKNVGVFLDEVYNMRNISNILYHNRKIFDKSITKALEEIDVIYRNIGQSRHDSTLLSYYENNSYYGSHLDVACFTVITWLYKTPKSFDGGELIFTDDNNKVIECLKNRIVLFPSFLNHAVSEIKINEDKRNKKFGRFALSQFIGF